MARLVRGNLRLVLESKINIIQPFEQAVAEEIVNLEVSRKFLPVGHLLTFEVNGQLIIFKVSGPIKQLPNFFFPEYNREQAVLDAVVGEDVGKGRCDYRAETEIRQRPHGMLAGRAAAEVLPRHQNASPAITRLVQHESGVWLSRWLTTPVVKQELPESGTLDALQELLGNDLVGINVDAIKRRHRPGMGAKRFHIPFNENANYEYR